MVNRREVLAVGGRAAVAAGVGLLPAVPAPAEPGRQRRLYVAVPGIRNYTEWGGAGVLVYDIDGGHRLLKRIATFPRRPGVPTEAVKGIAASARTGRLYVSTPRRLLCLDLISEEVQWIREYEGGCDRMALSPDGRLLYVPSLEGPHWTVVDGRSGEVVRQVVTDSGSHNTVYGRDGRYAYLAGLRSPYLFVAETRGHTVARKVGPFSAAIRPFTVNADQSLCFVTVNDLLGFEVGDLRTGRMLHRVEVPGYQKGAVKRHGCPSHGIGLTPDERAIWLCDGFNGAVHLFDASTMPPRLVRTLKVRDQPGWVTFTIDGQYAYPSTGEVFETATKRLVTTLADESGRPVQSEKLLEIDFENGRPVRAGDQFGIGRRTG